MAQTCHKIDVLYEDIPPDNTSASNTCGKQAAYLKQKPRIVHREYNREK